MESRSRGMIRPGFACSCPSKEEGAGNAGATIAPAALRASVESTQASHHRYAERTGIPCTMVLRLIRVLPGVPGFLATVASRLSARLDPASGQRRGIRATRFRRPAGLSLVSRGLRVHRILPPTLVTIAKRPSCGGRTRAVCTISDFRKHEYFCAEGWTGQISLNRLVKIVFRRGPICARIPGPAMSAACDST